MIGQRPASLARFGLQSTASGSLAGSVSRLPASPALSASTSRSALMHNDSQRAYSSSVCRHGQAQDTPALPHHQGRSSPSTLASSSSSAPDTHEHRHRRALSSPSPIRITYFGVQGPQRQPSQPQYHQYRSTSTAPSSSASSPGQQTGKHSGRWRWTRLRVIPRIDAASPPKAGYCSFVYSASLGLGLAFGMTLYSFLKDNVYLDGDEDNGAGETTQLPKERPELSLDDVTLLCLFGPPSSGKTTQASCLPKRFEGFEVLSDEEVQSVASIEAAIRKRNGSKMSPRGQQGGKEAASRLQLIADGFPRTLEEAKTLEKSVCPIFVVLFFDLPEAEAEKRQASSGSRFSTKGDLQPIVDHFRSRGNILEISAHWDSADEVWEQVEAKVEQVLELRDMGEDVSM